MGAALLTVVLLGALVPPAWAAFSDTATVTGPSVTTGSVPKPAEAAPGCTVDNPVLGTKSLTTSWSAAAAPAGITYTAKVRETGANLTVVVGSGTTRSATVTGNLLGTLIGSSFHIDVTATLGTTTWTAVSTRAGTVQLLGVGFTCGTWT